MKSDLVVLIGYRRRRLRFLLSPCVVLVAAIQLVRFGHWVGWLIVGLGTIALLFALKAIIRPPRLVLGADQFQYWSAFGWRPLTYRWVDVSVFTAIRQRGGRCLMFLGRPGDRRSVQLFESRYRGSAPAETAALMNARREAALATTASAS